VRIADAYAPDRVSPYRFNDAFDRAGHYRRADLAPLASQAAVALENARLVEAIQDLFETFVRASVKAIEVRDAATQGHSERIAALTVARAVTLNGIGSGPFADAHFSADHLRDLRYASLLYDFGKVAVPEYLRSHLAELVNLADR